MNLKVLQKSIEYAKCPIIIRQSGSYFEYITCINGEIYSSFIIARLSFLKRFFLKSYTKNNLEKITNYMLAMAQTTIDTVLSSKKDT